MTLTGSCSYCDCDEVFNAFRWGDWHFEDWKRDLLEPDEEPDIDDSVNEGEPYITPQRIEDCPF